MSLRDLLIELRRPSVDDELVSLKLREQFKRDYNIVVGLYSYGCFDRARVDPNTTLGRYCSLSRYCFILNRNHGMHFISTTPYIYNTGVGMVSDNAGMDYLSCELGDEVWMGHNSIITPSARKVGRGAVIAAGAIVTKDVEPYAVVAGNPAREIRRRFTPEQIERIEATRWWEWDLEEMKRRVHDEPDLIYRPAAYLERKA
jgi:acetyltransferase-like isoleucine patch superfamily enzyme